MIDDQFQEVDEPLKNLKNCPECNSVIEQDLFLLDYGRKKKNNEPGLIEARACFECKKIYEVIS